MPALPRQGRSAPEPPVGLAVELLLIAAGGACGAVARAAIAEALVALGAVDVLATQVVNGIGAFTLGLLLARLETTGPHQRLRTFLAVGVLGSFTTFSTLVADGHRLTTAGPEVPLASLLYLGLSLALGLGAFELAGLLHRRLVRIAIAERGETA